MKALDAISQSIHETPPGPATSSTVRVVSIPRAIDAGSDERADLPLAHREVAALSSEGEIGMVPLA